MKRVYHLPESSSFPTTIEDLPNGRTTSIDRVIRANIKAQLDWARRPQYMHYPDVHIYNFLT